MKSVPPLQLGVSGTLSQSLPELSALWDLGNCRKKSYKVKKTEARTRSSWVLSPGANLVCSKRLGVN